MDNKTPAEMKAALREKIVADQPSATRKQIESAIHGAIRRSVCESGKLPTAPVETDVEFSKGCSAFSNAGGIILERVGGIPISAEAAEAGRFVTVNWQGRIVAMTLEEAFDRALRENENWSAPCSAEDARRAITRNVVAAARVAGAFEKTEGA